MKYSTRVRQGDVRTICSTSFKKNKIFLVDYLLRKFTFHICRQPLQLSPKKVLPLNTVCHRKKSNSSTISRFFYFFLEIFVNISLRYEKLALCFSTFLLSRSLIKWFKTQSISFYFIQQNQHILSERIILYFCFEMMPFLVYPGVDFVISLIVDLNGFWKLCSFCWDKTLLK